MDAPARTDGDASGPAEAVSLAAERGRGLHYRNFDALRLLAAASVIFSHSFLIAEGSEAHEPLKQAGFAIVGLDGVFVFFIISGILVTESATARPGVLGFLWRRLLRIVPGFVVCNLVVITLSGLFFFADGSFAHFVRINLRTIVKHLLFIDTTGWLEGVRYFRHVADSSESEFNGSLWTLQQELLCYAGLAGVAALGRVRATTAALVLAASTTLFALKAFGPREIFENTLYSVPAFSSGVLAWALLRRFKPGAAGLCLCGLALGAAVWTRTLLYAFPPIAAYAIAWLGVSAPFDLRMPKRVGDLSYGAYLYGWPCEVLAKVWIGEGARWWQVALLGLSLALACGYASWWLVERPALRLKGWSALRRPRAHAAGLPTPA